MTSIAMFISLVPGPTAPHRVITAYILVIVILVVYYFSDVNRSLIKLAPLLFAAANCAVQSRLVQAQPAFITARNMTSVFVWPSPPQHGPSVLCDDVGISVSTNLIAAQIPRVRQVLKHRHDKLVVMLLLTASPPNHNHKS